MCLTLIITMAIRDLVRSESAAYSRRAIRILDSQLHNGLRRRNIAVSFITSQTHEMKTKANPTNLGLTYVIVQDSVFGVICGALAANLLRDRFAFNSLANRLFDKALLVADLLNMNFWPLNYQRHF